MRGSETRHGERNRGWAHWGRSARARVRGAAGGACLRYCHSSSSWSAIFCRRLLGPLFRAEVRRRQRLSEHRGCQNRTEGRHGEGKREQQRHSPALTTPTHSLLLTETASTALVSSVHYNHHSTCANRGGTTPRLLRARTVLDGLAFLHTAPAIIGARVGGRLWRGRHARRCSSCQLAASASDGSGTVGQAAAALAARGRGSGGV